MTTETVISGNAKIVRSINRSAILNIIREKQPVSRSTISKLTKLNKSTVSSIVLELLEDGLIREEPVKDSNIGRNPILLHLKLQEHYVGAIDIDPEISIIGIADIDGSIASKSQLKTDLSSPLKFTRRCARKLESLKQHLKIRQLYGIGVSITGIVDPEMGKIVNAPNLGWKDFDILPVIEECCPNDGPIIIENEANASALAELWFGKEVQNIDNFVFISEGIGSGIIIDGKLIVGSSHMAGEFGHMTVVENGEPCVCGNLGCWEAYASDRATVKRYPRTQAQNGNSSLTIGKQFHQILKRAREKEPEAIQTLRDTGHYLGLGIANIIKAIDPEAVVLGGRITRAWKIIYPEIMKEIKSRALFGRSKPVKIFPTSLKERPSFIGAATLGIKEIFSGLRITK